MKQKLFRTRVLYHVYILHIYIYMYMYHKCISCIHMYFPTYELYIHMLSASQPWWHDQQHGIKISCKASVGWPGASMKARVKFRVRYGSLDVKKTMGSLHRTVKWNQMGYRTTSSLCRPWNCFFFFDFFLCFLSTFLLAGYGPGDRRLCSWKEETTGIKQLGMVEIRVLE